MKSSSTFSVKKLVLLAMFAAISFLAVFLIRIPVVLFLKYEPKDVIITIGGFLLGPMAAFLISLIVSLLEMFSISETGLIGCVMNLLSTCSFACTAAFFYKKRHTLSGAAIGLTLGSVLMVIAMLLWNWLITPWYMGVNRQEVAAILLPVFLPFNLLKAGLNSALILGLYKPLVTALRKVGLVDSNPGTSKTSKAGVFLFSAALLITCIFFLLVIQGKI